MSKIDRRALVAGAATALPALAAAPAAAADAADAELLALGAQLEPIIQAWLAQKIIDEQERDLHPYPDPELTRWSAIHARLYPLVDAILSREAHTLAGLAVQARAFTLSSAEWWDDNPPCEEDQLAFG
jgi:hypothetical protein